MTNPLLKYHGSVVKCFLGILTCLLLPILTQKLDQFLGGMSQLLDRNSILPPIWFRHLELIRGCQTTLTTQIVAFCWGSNCERIGIDAIMPYPLTMEKDGKRAYDRTARQQSDPYKSLRR